MADTSYSARKGVYDALKGRSELAALVGDRIYAGSAPQRATYPYVVIGDRTTDQRFKTKDSVVQSHAIRIYAYSRVTSPSEVERIKGEVFNALEKQILTIPSGSFVDAIQEGLDDVDLEQDGRTYRAVVDFTITIQG